VSTVFQEDFQVQNVVEYIKRFYHHTVFTVKVLHMYFTTT